ncbi:hypothetical protein AWN76_015775 [Rhodothermaceae bacterium RA]|nr:hypothetical protein AWN76_015775 [Rhodothermaceae bacterium RA]
MLKKKAPHTPAVLGVCVTPEAVEAVLLRVGPAPSDPAGSAPAVDALEHFVRARGRAGALTRKGALTGALPGLSGSLEHDFTLHVGDGGNGTGSTFLSSEFGLSSRKDDTPAGVGPTPPFTPQLLEILEACAALGYDDPQIAFCITRPDATYEPVDLATALGAARNVRVPGGLIDPADLNGKQRRALITHLTTALPGQVDEKRIGFLPLTPVKTGSRLLAVVPHPRDAVTTTLEALRARGKDALPDARLLETEVSLYAALIHDRVPAEARTRSAVVRVNSRDTLILFFEGRTLRHLERMRAITSFEAPDTICSRVMLQQDEHKIGDLEQLYVAGEGRADELLAHFRAFYPEADVYPLQHLLSTYRATETARLDDLLAPNTLLALGTGLRLITARQQTTTLPPLPLLPRKLRVKQTTPRLGWTPFLLLGVLFAVSLYFVNRYLAQRAEILQQRTELMLNPVPAPAEPPEAIRARLDSIRQANQRRAQSLVVLDSLLYGSDRWSRFLEQTSRATGEVGGLWLRAWTSRPDGSVRVEGSAMDRTRIAAFARRMNATIDRVFSADIGNTQVYSFELTVPVPADIPDVARYLREQVEGSDALPGPSSD